MFASILLCMAVLAGVLADAPPARPIGALEAAAPAAKPLRAPRHGGVYVVAHRGAHQGIPENTLAAYRKAIELGVDFVEVDLRETKDGHIVSIHNDTVDAYTKDASGPVRDFSLAELRTMDIGSRAGPAWRNERIPTFEEILDLCQGKVGIYLDLKRAPVDKLVPMIQARGMERDVLWYASWRDFKQVRERCPECFIMPDPGPEKGLPRLLAYWKPQVVAAVWRHYSETFVKTCHEAGAIVIVDEGEPDCWADALRWGSDGIQTDHPGKLISFLEKREKEAATAN